MSYPRAGHSGEPPAVDPTLYQRDDLRAAIARHDFGTVYQVLRDEVGLSQRRIATLTGQSQSEVSEILSGRQVLMYSVLRRIVTGLGIPPGMAGLGWHGQDGSGAYPGQVTVADSEEAENMLRRHLLAQGGIAITGAAVAKLGTLLGELPCPPIMRLPAQLAPIHIVQVQDLTRRLAEADNKSICAPSALNGAAVLVRQLLDVPGTDQLQRSLKVAVAELHIEAGWSAFDADQYHGALYHYAHALDLATEARDVYLQALALGYAGQASIAHGHPDEGLKMAQCAQVKAWDVPRDDPRAVVVGANGRAAVEADTLDIAATAHVGMGNYDAAAVFLAKARDLWTPSASDPFGDLDRPAAHVELSRGRLEPAERFAAASMRRWQRGSAISRTQSGAVLATVYVKAGDSRCLPLVRQTITDVRKLSSARVRRQWVLPLAEALDARPGTDVRELARQARRVATTRL